MEWLIMPSNSLRVTASKMGYMKDGVYIIGDECEASLEEVLHNLQQEDTVSRSVRREIASSNLVQDDLFPILKAGVNDLTISYLVIKVLSNLTLPMAVIMPVKHQMTRQDWEKRRGVQHMESAIKSHCADAQVTNILVNHIKNNIEDAGEYVMEKTCVGMNLEIIALLRNVLHADDIRPGSTNGDTIISNLIDAGFDDAVVGLLARDEGAVWVPTLTQVLGLMFRSQKSSELLELVTQVSGHKAENDDNKSSPESSDEDKKGNNSKAEEGPKLPGVNGYDHDAMTVDNKDTPSQNVPKIQVEPGADKVEGADLTGDGYRELDARSDATDPKSVSSEGSSLSEGKSENESVLSDSSSLSPLCEGLQNGVQVVASEEDSSRSATPTNDMNDDSSTSSGSMDSGSCSSSSTIDGERAIRQLKKKLSQFALKFAKKGLDRCILLCQTDLLKGLEDMCFLWVQNFFLMFANHPSVTYADIRHTVSSAILSNLTYLACQSWQQFKMSSGKDRKKGQSNSRFKKLYLIMAVLRQILSQLRRYSEQTTLSEEEQKWFQAATETLCCTTNLRNLYPMLIRLFQPRNETLQYLRELILGNSELLRLYSNTHDKHVENGKEVMLQHFKDFVDYEVISSYNYLLSSFSQNTLAENEAVFTFYYHIVMDLNSVEQLFQVPLFQTFASIWETESPPVSQDSLELMDYIIYKYTELSLDHPDDGLEIAKETAATSRKKQPKGKKRKHVENEEDASIKKSKVAILDKMLQTDEEIRGLYCVGSCTESSDDDFNKETETTDHKNIQECLEELKSRGYGSQIGQLQSLLLEVCYVKLNCPKTYPAEPIVWQYCADRKSIPLFAFTLKDRAVQSLKVFKNFLQKMGLHQAMDSSHLFASIPAFMTPEMTFALAKILGPVNKTVLKFDVTEDMQLLPEHLVYPGTTLGADHDSAQSDDDQPIESLRPTHGLRAPGGMWMGIIKKANSKMSTLPIS